MDFSRSLMPHSAPEMVQDIWCREFDGARKDGGLFLLTMHPHITGHRSRIGVLEKLIAHMNAHGDVWFATHEQVARYCLARAGV